MQGCCRGGTGLGVNVNTSTLWGASVVVVDDVVDVELELVDELVVDVEVDVVDVVVVEVDVELVDELDELVVIDDDGEVVGGVGSAAAITGASNGVSPPHVFS